MAAVFRWSRLAFTFVIVAFGVLLCVGATMADGTAQCNRSASLGAAVDRCPYEVNPCCLERVDTGTNRYELMRDSDPAKPVSVLIVALSEIDGTTSSEYSTLPVVSFWNEGWKAAQRYVPRGANGAPIALVMNSGPTRGYARVHLHLSCASAKLLAALHDHAFSANAWTPIVMPGISALHVPDRTFRVRTTSALIDDPNPGAPPRNPFSVVVADTATPDLQNHAMAIVGPADGGGWYVVDRTVGPSEPKLSGYIEDALDETCGGRSLHL